MRYIKLFVLVISFIFIYGCVKQEKPQWALDIDDPIFGLELGEERAVDIIVHDYYKDQQIVFESNDDLIAIVENGVLISKGIGDTVIRVSLEGYPEEYIELRVYVTLDENNVPTFVMNWLEEEIGTEMWTPQFFPTKHPQFGEAVISYKSLNTGVLSNEGITFQQDYNVYVDLEITVEYKKKTITKIQTINVVGYAYAVMANKFFAQLPVHRKIFSDYDLKTQNLDLEFSDAVLSWTSSNSEVFTNNGKYTKPYNDTKFIIELEISFPGHEDVLKYSQEYTAIGVSISEKANTVKQWIDNEKIINVILTQDVELPIYYSDDIFEAVLVWSSNKTNIVDADGKITPSGINELVTLSCRITVDGQSSTISFNTEVIAKEEEDKWVEIEAFLNEIFLEKIKTQRYTVSGGAPSFIAYNYGYVPFYTNEKSNVTVDILPSTHWLRPSPGQTRLRKYVVIHDTANNRAGAGALMHNNYIKTTDRQASWHYTVDDTYIIQHIPDVEVAWHAGDADGNNYGIGIETCVNPESDYTTVMLKTAKLTGELLNLYNLSLKDIRQHYDFTEKDCPYVMRHTNRWEEFLYLAGIAYTGIKKFSDVDFVWESLSKNIMDDTGRVHNHPGIETNVSFKVVVTYKGVTKTYTHTATLLPKSW